MLVRLAATPWLRLRGLLGENPGHAWDGAALLIVPCSSIHTYFMRAPIDIAFIDASGVVVASICHLEPGRRASCRGAHAVLERFSPACPPCFIEPACQIEQRLEPACQIERRLEPACQIGHAYLGNHLPQDGCQRLCGWLGAGDWFELGVDSSDMICKADCIGRTIHARWEAYL